MTREEAVFYIKELQKTFASMDKKVAEAVDVAIEALSAEAVQVTRCEHYTDGEWIKDGYDIPHCSECNCINNTVYRNYCPNCGAKMEVEK